LPKETRFAHLYAPEWYAGRVRSLCAEVSPRIEGRPTLWLNGGEPHLAYGGAPVSDIPLLFSDTYHARSERPLCDYWAAHPPEYVVRGPFVPARGGQFLAGEFMTNWLNQHYALIWRDEALDLSLWRRTGR
jgi:hypothetical protein